MPGQNKYGDLIQQYYDNFGDKLIQPAYGSALDEPAPAPAPARMSFGDRLRKIGASIGNTLVQPAYAPPLRPQDKSQLPPGLGLMDSRTPLQQLPVQPDPRYAQAYPNYSRGGDRAGGGLFEQYYNRAAAPAQFSDRRYGGVGDTPREDLLNPRRDSFQTNR